MSAGFDQPKEKYHGKYRPLQEVRRQQLHRRDRHPQRASARQQDGSLQKKNVTIVAEEPSENENAPSHRVFVAKAEIGACWQKTSKEGRDYLSIKLDDPSFTAPIFASLFADDDGKTFNLIWSRARTSNGN